MKIKVIFSDSSSKMEKMLNEALEDILGEGYLLIDFGIEARDKGGLYGYVKYCDKQFLRNYKIKSIMSEL